MNRSTKNACAVLVLASAFGIARAQTTADTTTTIPPPGQTRVAAKFAAPFVTFAGSNENAVALATALRNGTPVTLTYTTTDSNGTTTTTTTTFTPPTQPMGWGNVRHSLALAQYSLTQQGITNPTAAQLEAALVGGTVTGADGTDVALTGVLQQRASGMGFGQIAHSYGTTMGAVNRSIKTPPTTTSTSSATQPVAVMDARGQTTRTAGGVTTAAGATTAVTRNSRGVTTAAGTTTQPSAQSSKGLTTAAATPAAGRGIVTAAGSNVVVSPGKAHSGSSASVVTAAGVSAPHDSHKGGNGKGKGGG